MKLLLTGASGFLGKRIQKELKELFQIIDLGRKEPSTIICDLGEEIPIINEQIDFVVHCAGKAHVIPKSKEEADAFFNINHKGTNRLLSGLDKAPCLPKTFVFISTIAVYGKDKGENIKEETPLFGQTPYALSKIQAEKDLEKWSKLNNVKLIILRLPLVVDTDPPGNLGAMKRAIQKGFYPTIGGNQAKKSAVLARDVAMLLPTILDKEGIYNLTDDQDPKFIDIEKAISQAVNKKIKLSIPLSLLKLGGRAGSLIEKTKLRFPINTFKVDKITESLTFSCEKAKKELGWKPNSVLPFIEKNI